MGACTCTYTRDEEKNCDGTHKVVKAVKAEMAEKLEANGFPHASEFVKNNQFVLVMKRQVITWVIIILASLALGVFIDSLQALIDTWISFVKVFKYFWVLRLYMPESRT